jgi:hypothetical protein
VTFDCANRGLCDDHVARTSGKVPGVTVLAADLSAEALALLDFHRAVMAARQALPALSHGSRAHLVSDHRVYADLKRYAGQEVVFAMNVTDEPHTLVLAGALFEARTPDAWEVLENRPVPADEDVLVVDLPPQSGRYLLLANEAPAALQINPGLNDAWFEPATSGQGVFINVFPDRRQLFLAWFTFDAELSDAPARLGAPGQRWFTAFGPYQANLAELDLQVTAGGMFDQGTPVPGTETVGRVRLEVRDCTRIVMSYEHHDPALSGTLPLQRIVADNAALCEVLDSVNR